MPQADRRTRELAEELRDALVYREATGDDDPTPLGCLTLMADELVERLKAAARKPSPRGRHRPARRPAR